MLRNLVGTHRHPGRYSCRFTDQAARARRTLGEDQLGRSGCQHVHAGTGRQAADRFAALPEG